MSFDLYIINSYLRELPTNKTKYEYLALQEALVKNDPGFRHQSYLFQSKLDSIISLKKSYLLLHKADIKSGNFPDKIKYINTFKLSGKKGSKINLIRILNAIYDLQLLENTNGDFPSKEQFFIKFGEFISIDLSDYQKDLSQSFNEMSKETNLAIFNKMIDIITKKLHK